MNDLRVTLTDKAAEIILDTIESQNVSDAYLAFYVSGGGCSGLQYGLALADGEPDLDEIVLYDKNVKIAVDRKSAKYVSGSIIDYVETSMGGGFKVENPQAVKTCGCSSSFSTGDDDISELNQGSGCNACKS
jgi:iron-sulfur cluster assembly accessory protein